MLERVGRNDACPCGSGLKYKKCCLKKEEDLAAHRRVEGTAVSRAIDWLTQHYPQQVSDAIEQDFFKAIETTERDHLNMVSTGLQGRIQLNFRDWLVNEACFVVEGEKIPVCELLLGPGKLQLTPADLECLAAMGEFPLSMYEVQNVKPGEGVELSDVLRPGTEPVWIIEKTASRSLTPLDIFGGRLLRRNNAFVMSGAVYPFIREEALACRDDILREMEGVQWDTSPAREVVSQHIIKLWLEGLVAKCIHPALEERSTEDDGQSTTPA